MPCIQRADGVDVTGNQMPAKPLAKNQRPLDIDETAGLQSPKIGAAQSFFAGLKAEPFAVDRHDSEAAAIDRDTVADGGAFGERAKRNDDAHARRFGRDVIDASKEFDKSSEQRFD